MELKSVAEPVNNYLDEDILFEEIGGEDEETAPKKIADDTAGFGFEEEESDIETGGAEDDSDDLNLDEFGFEEEGEEDYE